MAKVGKVFKGLFKVIFACLTIVTGVLVFGFLGLNFLEYTGSASGWGVTLTTSTYVTGYSLAFKGPLMAIANAGSATTGANSLGNVGMSVGMLIAFILLCVALVFAVIYLVCAWGKKGAEIKKFFAFGSALCFLACGVLFFCVVPLGKSALMELLKSEEIVKAYKIGSGAICSGVFSIVAALFALIAGALGPKDN